MRKIKYKPIGIIHSPFKDIAGMPIQPGGAKGIRGTIEMAPKYVPGLKDLEGFSHIFLIYHFHLSKGYALHVQPFMDNTLRGVFATRAPRRPNPIGISVVKLLKIKEAILFIEDVDVVDGTPLLDIKPYLPEFDTRKVQRIGWLAKKAHLAKKAKADDRFNK